MVAMLARVLVLLAVSTLSWSKPPKVVSRPRSIALDGAKASAAPPNATAADESGPRHLTEFTVREPPVFSPDGGTFLAPVAVSLSATDGDAASTNGPHRVFYTTDGTQPTRESASVESGTVVVMSKPGVLRAFVRSPSVADKVDTDGALDGPEYSAYFGVETYRSGVAYLVPYYHGQPGHSAKLVSIDLFTDERNKVRIHDVYTDFADYYSETTYKNGGTIKSGCGAYKGQLGVADLSDLDPTVSGFQGGFLARHQRKTEVIASDEEYTYRERIYVDLNDDATRAEMVDVTVRTQEEEDEAAEGAGDEETAAYTSPWSSWSRSRSANETRECSAANLQGYLTYDEVAEDPHPIEEEDRLECSAQQREEYNVQIVNRTTVTEAEYGFLVPYYNGEDYKGTVVRLKLSSAETVYQRMEFDSELMVCCPQLYAGTMSEVVGTPRNNMNANAKAAWLAADHAKDVCCRVNATRTARTDVTTTTDRSYALRPGPDFVEEEDWAGPGSWEPHDWEPAVDFLDLTALDPELRGFLGGFACGEHAYFVPYWDGFRPGRKVARVDIHEFSLATVKVIDLSRLDASLAGFFGGFGYTNGAKNYGFLIPYRNAYGPVGRDNSEMSVDGHTGEVNKERSAVGGSQLTAQFFGKLVRLDLGLLGDISDLSDASTELETCGDACVQTLDLTLYDADLRGFAGGFVAGRYGYLVPYRNREGAYFGKVVKVDLESFTVDTVLDLAKLDTDLVGFVGGFANGKHGYLVPHRNDKDTNYNSINQHGKVVRFLLDDFVLDEVDVLDVADITRRQVPDIPDPTLRGFMNGFAAGGYSYLVPHFNSVFFGKTVRMDERDFGFYSDLQKKGEPTSVLSGYDGVQYIDLQLSDQDLAGFSGGFAGAGEATAREWNTPEASWPWLRKHLAAMPWDDAGEAASEYYGRGALISPALWNVCDARPEVCAFVNGVGVEEHAPHGWKVVF